MDGEGDTQVGDGQDWVWFDVEECGGEEDEVLWTHHLKWHKLLIEGKVEGKRQRLGMRVLKHGQGCTGIVSQLAERGQMIWREEFIRDEGIGKERKEGVCAMLWPLT